MYPDKINENRLQQIGSTTNNNFPKGHTGNVLIDNSLNAPVSTTEEQTIILHETVSQIDKLVGILHGRLDSVLKESNPTSVEESTEESLPPLANTIRQSRYIAQGCVSKLNDILGRLDI